MRRTRLSCSTGWGGVSFRQDLDQEGFCATAERPVNPDESLLGGDEGNLRSFDEEANFCNNATQVHTRSPTYV